MYLGSQDFPYSLRNEQFQYSAVCCQLLDHNLRQNVLTADCYRLLVHILRQTVLTADSHLSTS